MHISLLKTGSASPQRTTDNLDLHKQIRTNRGLKYTKYASVYKRVKTLEESGYIRRAGSRKTKAGFKAPICELTIKVYLALLLNPISLEELLWRLDETSGNEILANIICIVGSSKIQLA